MKNDGSLLGKETGAGIRSAQVLQRRRELRRVVALETSAGPTVNANRFAHGQAGRAQARTKTAARRTATTLTAQAVLPPRLRTGAETFTAGRNTQVLRLIGGTDRGGVSDVSAKGGRKCLRPTSQPES